MQHEKSIKNEIGICVIGAGRAGMIHAANFAKNVPGARLAAIADPNPNALEAAREQLGAPGCAAYRSHLDALADGGVDAYVVVAPTKFHREIVVALAGAGKHVLCEKPMAMTPGECDEMTAAAEKAGVVLQIGFMRRFDAGFARAKEIVASGEIGDVVMIRSNTRGPSEPQPWMYDIKASNGPLAEVNSHDIDTLRWFAESEFETVYALGGNFRSPAAKRDYPDFYDNVVVAAGFENGVQGMMDGAQGVGYAYDARAEVLGTKGCVLIGRTESDAVVTYTAASKRGVYPLVSSWRQLFREAYLAEDTAFVEAIRRGQPPKVTGHDGKMAVKVVNAGNLSIREKRVVRLSEISDL
ncbi:MAG: Gfo/Idh/MocA family oxidoreductase [Clostridiales bacterium]|jgi:myo-inositol 2-dehydrogenase/D-chiro-inositol 1-dehydrogenase/scyllo-inositol 2-dehydrogenase (NAD+)|nr:Gfo/Idh/MocA family oxidoreductase [Clostridiales bacterium]